MKGQQERVNWWVQTESETLKTAVIVELDGVKVGQASPVVLSVRLHLRGWVPSTIE
jgi:hypothetical protein